MSIKDKTIILIFEIFYSYYAELFWRSKDLKDHLWTFYSYFLILSKITGSENKVLRLQAFDTLQAIIEQNNFRLDLYHRLNVINIHVPALNDRRDDIPLLVKHFLTNVCNEYKI